MRTTDEVAKYGYNWKAKYVLTIINIEVIITTFGQRAVLKYSGEINK